MYLYALNLVSNLSWGRNMTGASGRRLRADRVVREEPFPVGPVGISAFALRDACPDDVGLDPLRPVDQPSVQPRPTDSHPAAERGRRVRAMRVVAGVLLMPLFGATITWGVESRDNLFWKHELVASFFRPEGFAFEPTARREAVAERDAVASSRVPATWFRAPTARTSC